MKYKILLQDRQTGATTTLLASPRDCVETLSPRIKVALSLPYLDYGMHRFLARGTAYILADRLYVEPEIRFECRQNLHNPRFSHLLRTGQPRQKQTRPLHPHRSHSVTLFNANANKFRV